VSKTASPQEIKEAFYELSKKVSNLKLNKILLVLESSGYSWNRNGAFS
jgi:hypothetical protein